MTTHPETVACGATPDAAQPVTSHHIPSDSTPASIGPSLLKKLWSSVIQSLKPLQPVRAKEGDIWIQEGTVAFAKDENQSDRTMSAIIQLDSGCENVNLISADFMRTLGWTQDPSCEAQDVGELLNGETVQSLGTVKVRWFAPEFRMRRYADATCHIMETEKFDLLMGKADLVRLRLYKINRPPRIFALYPRSPTVRGESRQQKNDEAKTAREKEKQDKAEREKQKAQGNSTSNAPSTS
ncbi:hypothetical protein PTRG_05844 [Pyrenophora tritici-repentis Pt-1C-BFP]|uniref:Uncharacterized protein n=2 Tax=Pyrenophora tritici-repentis TaxID=45151 RepID=A0A922T0I0_9PLEO|nr:uncharacterized protein PTRG_05844 [Pyrenophora tritici-repentis Pt-1C-BFP]EDU48764.1 hypothetical protein PTRG_05844 [Pyrenophora tritici-repentis Pt-1C-BFP]KAI1514513.1 hypothetical protein Ptr86124_007143 [Pyrenophora tritici-repentis]